MPSTDNPEKVSTELDIESMPQYVASVSDVGEVDSQLELQKELEEEADNEIKFRSCSWYRTAMLLASEYICLAAMSFPWSFSVLGLIPGLILTVGIAVMTMYTGLVIGDYCAKYPRMQSICDIGQHLFWNKRWAYWGSVFCFLCLNTLIQSLHVLVGAKYLNTITNHGACTVIFAFVTLILGWLFSLPRTFSHMSYLALFSAGTMFVALVLGVVFAIIQGKPEDYDPSVPVVWGLWPEKGTTYVDGMNAMLNILFVLAGQASYPSFIAEMRNPKDFKKALWVVTVFEVIVYCVVGGVVYVYSGDAYITIPSFGSLNRTYKIIGYSFTVPTIIFLGSLFSNLSARLIFNKIYSSTSIHRTSHTKTGWLAWAGLNLFLWILGFIFAQVIPFFNDLLSLMSSLFACWFGFVFWGVAYIRLKEVKYKGQFTSQISLYALFTTKEKVLYWCNIFIIGVGIYLLGPGTYATVQSIILNYKARLYGDVFTCVSNGI